MSYPASGLIPQGHKKTTSQNPPKVNLLVDIQAKIQEGKGRWLYRWASAFNLKQIAQTLNYLTEHKLLNYADLSAKTAEATTRANDLLGEIKSLEKRMAEIAALKTHIINYSKTREVYAAYRRAGYSKAFRAEHESEILLHQASKKAFDELGLKKLPTFKSLLAEYGELLAKKKALYADYRKSRDEMRELLTVKANTDRILGKEARKKEAKTTQKEVQR